ncbi:MAG: hypothetical protein LBK61_06690 [Spirochaetaceae bacterium]|nr:hypothetical protein [Spirochaetaceae bacterium]
MGYEGPLITGRDLTDGTDFLMDVLRACGEWARDGTTGRIICIAIFGAICGHY